MNARGPRTAGKRSEGGYALLLVIFLVTLVLVTVIAASPNILTEGNREKEKEMIWRGNQYARGVKLHFRKTGRFPTSLDDLTKPKLGSLRFMRQAYKDPMNKADGAWRLIYVGPSGQLIGSLKPPQTINLSAAGGSQPGTPASALAGANQPQLGANAGQPPAGAQAGATPGTPGSATQQNPTSADQGESPSNSVPGSLKDTPTIIGGNIIGVGSKVPEQSIKIYEKAKNYRLFEFVWDPSKDALAIGGQVGTQVGSPVTPGQGRGQTPFGTPPLSNPMNPPTNQQQPPPNPNPNAPSQ